MVWEPSFLSSLEEDAEETDDKRDQADNHDYHNCNPTARSDCRDELFDRRDNGFDCRSKSLLPPQQPPYMQQWQSVLQSQPLSVPPLQSLLRPSVWLSP